jgi:hypothetical protein
MAAFYATMTLSDKLKTGTRLLLWEHNYVEYETDQDRIHLVRWDKGSTLRLTGSMWSQQVQGLEGPLVHSYIKRQTPKVSDIGRYE